MFNFCDFIQVYVFTTNHHLKGRVYICFESQSYYNRLTDSSNYKIRYTMLVFFLFIYISFIMLS